MKDEESEVQKGAELPEFLLQPGAVAARAFGASPEAVPMPCHTA